MPKPQTILGTVLTAVGLVGIFISFTIQTSDVDPTAMGVAFVSIATAIIGISLIIGNPTPETNRTKQKTTSTS